MSNDITSFDEVDGLVVGDPARYQLGASLPGHFGTIVSLRADPTGRYATLRDSRSNELHTVPLHLILPDSSDLMQVLVMLSPVNPVLCYGDTLMVVYHAGRPIAFWATELVVMDLPPQRLVLAEHIPWDREDRATVDLVQCLDTIAECWRIGPDHTTDSRPLFDAALALAAQRRNLPVPPPGL